MTPSSSRIASTGDRIIGALRPHDHDKNERFLCPTSGLSENIRKRRANDRSCQDSQCHERPDVADPSTRGPSGLRSLPIEYFEFRRSSSFASVDCSAGAYSSGARLPLARRRALRFVVALQHRSLRECCFAQIIGWQRCTVQLCKTSQRVKPNADGSQFPAVCETPTAEDGGDCNDMYKRAKKLRVPFSPPQLIVIAYLVFDLLRIR